MKTAVEAAREAAQQDTKDSTKATFTERSVKEAYDELVRELQVRDRCYSGWVRDGRLSRTDARDRYDRLKSAIHYLETAYPKEAIGTTTTEDGSY